MLAVCGLGLVQSSRASIVILFIFAKDSIDSIGSFWIQEPALL